MDDRVLVEVYDPGAHPPHLLWSGYIEVHHSGDRHTLRLPALRFTPRVVLRYPDGRVEDSVAPACARECGEQLRAEAVGAGRAVQVSTTPPPADRPAPPAITWVMCPHQEVYMVVPEGAQHDAPG